MTSDGEERTTEPEAGATARKGRRPRPIVDGRKQCSRCGEWKPLAEFHRQSRSPAGVHYKCKPCNYATARLWKSAHPERRREHYLANPRPTIDRHLRRLYGITLAQYEGLLVAQDNRCAICGARPSERRRLDVDHDHESGRIRGLLCPRCNLALGQIGHDPARARALADYLEGAAR